jgi:phage/plasmid-associated DNA primase
MTTATHTITYCFGVFTKQKYTIDANKYKSICEKKSCCEYVNNATNSPVKLYFDVDIKKEGCIDLDIAPTIQEVIEDFLEYFIETSGRTTYSYNDTAVAESHSERYRPVDTMIDKETKVRIPYLKPDYLGKISFHFVLNNIIASVKHIGLLVKRLNREAKDYINKLHSELSPLFTKPNGKFELFDESVYGNGDQKIRSVYASKELENRPLKLVRGEFEQSCISAFIPEGAFLWVEEEEERPVLMAGEARIQDTEKDRAIFNAGLELLRPYAQGGQYAHWIRIGWAIKNTFDDASLFHEFSKLGGKEYDRSSVEDYWYGMETSIDGVKMGTIIDYMRKTDKTKTDAILSMFSTSKEPPTDARNLLMETVNEDTDTDGETNSEQSVEQPKVSYYISIDKLEDPHECAKVITQTLKHTLVLCSEKWYMVSSDNLWATQSEPTYYITSEIRKYIDEGQKQTAHKISRAEGEAKDKLIEIQKRYLKAYRDISRPAFLSVITKNLKTLLCDRLFTEKIDKLTDHLAFKNGILNLKTRQFRRGILPSDYITQTIEYDYMPANPEKTQYVKDVLLKILNNNPEHLEYFLSIIGYTFIGRPKLEKAFYFCVDKTTSSKGDNGKTFYFDILSNLMACYVYKTQGNFLEKNNTKKHKQLAKMKASRLVWLDEFGTNNMDAEFVKTLGDGLTTENEVMFGTSETINIQFKVFGLTNHLIRMASNEDAVFNRYTQISYGSHFDKTGTRTVEEPNKLLFIADKTLSDRLIQDYRNEIFGLVIEYANRYYSSGLPKVPTQFQADAQETKINNDEFAMWIHENCIVDDDARVALKALVYESGMPEKKIKDNMKRLGYKYDKDLRKCGKDDRGLAYKGGYVGVKLNEKEAENEDVEEDV